VCQQHDADLRWLALLIRRGLLLIVRGVEAKYSADKEQTP
jgi:hypothetical protein